jgi:RND family efflux transporter MFP subunit
MLQTNAQITQLSYQKQEIVSRLSGHVEMYYVKAGDTVKSGDKVVLIESIDIAKRTADYLALGQQIKPALTQVTSTRVLYKKGLASKNQLNQHLIALETLRSQKEALASQLQTLGIDTDTLTKATDNFTLYAHADGVVDKILASLHSNVDAQTTLMTLVKQKGYYATAFLSPNDAMKVTPETKGWIHINDKSYRCHFVQRIRTIDKETHRAKVRFSIENSPDNLLLGAFKQIDISLAPTREVLMIKKSALTLFKGEWVVFTPTKHKEDSDSHEEHGHEEKKTEVIHEEDVHDAHEKETDPHEGHGHDTHKEETHDTPEADEHEEHGHEEEKEEAPYQANVVKIIDYLGEYVAIEGIKAGEAYVSGGVYFVKSMLLRSSLGGHGH